MLIIDDNQDAAESLPAFLTESGFSCASALDGPSGLQAVASFAPNTVLIDLGLPGMDGYEVARQIRARPDGDRHLMVAMTGYGGQRGWERSAEAGFDAHMVKPVDLDQLLAVLRRTSRRTVTLRGGVGPGRGAPRAGGPRPTDRLDVTRQKPCIPAFDRSVAMADS